MKNVLVIGASGFIGSHLVERISHKGYVVTALVRPSSDTTFLKSLGTQLRFADLLDKDSLVNAVKGIDTVFCAVNIKPAGRSKQAYEKDIFLVHAQGVKNLVDACKESKTRRIIYFSSVAAMGYEKGVSFYDESFSERPIDAYGKAKLEAETILNQASSKKEVDITILRPPGVFGERGLGAIAKIIGFVGKGLVPVIGRGRNMQSIAYVGNIVNQAIWAAENPDTIGKTYIAGDDRPYSVNELIESVCSAMNKRPLRIHIPVFVVIFAVNFLNFVAAILLRREIINKESIMAVATERVFDSSKIFRELGFKQEHDLRDSVRRTVAWYSHKTEASGSIPKGIRSPINDLTKKHSEGIDE